jgi:flagellar assembly protein FliH
MTSSSDLISVFQPARLGLAAEAEDVRAAARATGYAAGWAEGRRAAAQQAESEIRRLAVDDARIRQATRARADAAIAAAIQDWTERTTPVLDELADLVVDAALDLAEAIIGRELAASAKPETARLALRRALSPLPSGSPVTVRMNPTDLAAIDDGAAHEGHLVTFVADAGLASGDAVAEQDGAMVDARVASALSRARAVARG